MMRILLTATLCLFLFANQSFASYLDEFSSKSAFSFLQLSALKGSSLSPGEGTGNGSIGQVNLVFDDLFSDIDTIHEFRFDWETSIFSGALADLNTGSLVWSGSFRDLVSREHLPTLILSGNEIDLTKYFPEIGNGNGFLNVIGDEDTVRPLVAAGEQSANVPIPGAIWLVGSGLVGLAGLRRKFVS